MFRLTPSGHKVINFSRENHPILPIIRIAGVISNHLPQTNCVKGVANVWNKPVEAEICGPPARDVPFCQEPQPVSDWRELKISRRCTKVHEGTQKDETR